MAGDLRGTGQDVTPADLARPRLKGAPSSVAGLADHVGGARDDAAGPAGSPALLAFRVTCPEAAVCPELVGAAESSSVTKGGDLLALRRHGQKNASSTLEDNVESKDQRMDGWIGFAVVLAVWTVVQVWLLPRLGVPT